VTAKNNVKTENHGSDRGQLVRVEVYPRVFAHPYKRLSY